MARPGDPEKVNLSQALQEMRQISGRRTCKAEEATSANALGWGCPSLVTELGGPSVAGREGWGTASRDDPEAGEMKRGPVCCGGCLLVVVLSGECGYQELRFRV